MAGVLQGKQQFPKTSLVKPQALKVPNLPIPTGTGTTSGATPGVAIQGAGAPGSLKPKQPKAQVKMAELLEAFEKLAATLNPEDLETFSRDILDNLHKK